ncbi:VOC family protein [Vibrio barjaei]|uniref:VOC family protein n=1 Tax=Vibrio barjaei TaxID=1676683 RepID=A0ABW7ITK2_9VIBR
MDFNDLIPELLVTNIGLSEEFYTTELGFSVAFRRDGFVFLTFNSAQLMLTQLKPDSWVNGESDAPLGRGMNLTFKVTSEWLDSLVVAPSDVFLPLQTETYQTGESEMVVRQTIVKDPDGYLIRFICQSTAQAIV